LTAAAGPNYVTFGTDDFQLAGPAVNIFIFAD
jgi:hypothetical protein